jgi:hypothetical protein
LSADVAMNRTRRIGTFGTVARVLVGAALLVLAFADQPHEWAWGVEPHELVLGLGVFPVVMVGIGLLAGRYSDGPLHLTTSAGTTGNCVIIIALFAIPYTTGAAALFYGTSLIVGALQGLPDCEATALSNLILRRDDQIGCPVFTPIDAWESRLKRRRDHLLGSR